MYHTITFANLHVLKGHQGEVTYVTWSKDDLKLVSCADNGSVYEWNAATGNRNLAKPYFYIHNFMLSKKKKKTCHDFI